MVFTTHLEPVANTFLLLTNVLNAVRIDELSVPPVVASDCLDAVLECRYSGASDDVTVAWLLDGAPVYEWRPGAEPRASGVLEGRLDLTYRLASVDGRRRERRALRIIELSPAVSGDYTCAVRSRGREARASARMTVFSPEREFELTYNTTRDSDFVVVRCVAKRLHPRPDLMIEYNNGPAPRQQQRSWRAGAYFDAESTAAVPRAPAELACRLRLPRLDYTAITKKHLHLENLLNGSTVESSVSSFITASVLLLLSYCNINI